MVEVVLNNSIPSELMNAFRLKKVGFSLLLKGEPGTGKTTLALELLTSVPHGIYVSTRVTPKALYAQFPWLEAYLSADRIIDATHPRIPKTAPITPQLRFQNLPDFLQAIHSQIDSKKAVTVVIDSWDAVTIEANRPEKLRWETTMTGLTRLGNYNLILVSEDTKTGPLDYLVDGILLLEVGTYEERRFRHLRIKKLRGIENQHPSYLFTLKNGRFQYFSQISLASTKLLEKKAPIPDPGPEYVSSGCHDFDRILNPGYGRGSLNLFEFAHNIPNEYQFLLRAPVFNFLAMDRGVCIVAAAGVDAPKILEDSYLPVFGEEVLKARLRVFEDRSPPQEDSRPYLVRHPHESLPHYFQNILAATRTLKRLGSDPACLWTGFSQIENLFDIETIKAHMGPFFAEFKHKGDVGIITANKWQEITKYITPMANTYWKIRMVDKALVLYGIIPPTEPFVLELAPSHPYPYVRLVPIT